jgi:hypothetical protein
MEGISHASYISGSRGVKLAVFLVIHQLKNHGSDISEEGK